MISVSIVGRGVTLTCSELDKRAMKKIMKDDDPDIWAIHDDCKKSIGIQGVFDDNCQVFVDGEPWNDLEGTIELMSGFRLINEPIGTFIEIEDEKYALITTEFEEGEMFSIEVDDFDERKLVLYRREYDEYALITATYDGKQIGARQGSCRLGHAANA